MYKSQRKEVIVVVLLTFGIVTFYLFIFIINLYHFNYKINADIASDVILAKLIWTSKEIIPSTWYLSSEARILSAPNFAALFYGLTLNMTLAEGLACSLMTIFILSGIFYFGRKAELKRSETRLFAFLGLAIPSNMAILELLYLFASYYAIHTAILFLTLGVYVESIRKREIRCVPAVISIALALCLGLQGARGILVLYGPLFGIEVIRIIYRIYLREKGEKSEWMISFWVLCQLVASFIGTYFPFSVEQNFSRNIRNGFRKLATVVIPDMGRYRTDIIGKVSLGIMLIIILYLLGDIMYRMWKKEVIDAVSWAFLVICASPVVTALLVAFTTVEDSERYYFLLVFAMAFAVVLIWRKLKSVCRIFLGILITVLVVINIYTVYLPIMRETEPPATEAYEVGKYLEENSYFTAYATFENANTITVLTNGRVRVASVASVDKMDICKWMTSTDWYVPNVPFEEKTAYIITESETSKFSEFLKEHEEEVRFETSIGKYLIYTSDFNFSVLE